MSYVLESKEEFERLERQSLNPACDYRRELAGLVVPPGARVLDAGCGSGVVTRYLASLFPTARVEGCDRSGDRVRAAGDAAPGLSFTRCDLTKLPFAPNSFDVIVCRYVFQHLGRRAAAKAARELLRVLKPGGTLKLIDGDGLLVNLYPQTKCVQRGLAKLAREGVVDFQVGRKLPSLLAGAGFRGLSWQLLTAEHSGAARETEVALMRERFEVGKPQFEKHLGKKGAARFAGEFLATLASSESAYFTETFVVTATKLRLRLVP